MKDPKRFDEDEQIIGTPRYETFQQMCREAGLFAIKEANFLLKKKERIFI